MGLFYFRQLPYFSLADLKSTPHNFPSTMDFFTLAWIILMSISGLVIGLRSLIKGGITVVSRTGNRVSVVTRPSFQFYFISFWFVLSALALILVSLYLYV